MLKIKKGVHFKHMLDKYEFHQGYNQYIDNKRYYYICETDNIRINKETKEITCSGSLWISSKDYYTYGGIEKLYDLIKADLVEKIEE